MGNRSLPIFGLCLILTLMASVSLALDEEWPRSSDYGEDEVSSGEDFVQITRQERKFRTYSADPSAPQIISYFEDEKDYQEDNDLGDVAPVKTEFGGCSRLFACMSCMFCLMYDV